MPDMDSPEFILGSLAAQLLGNIKQALPQYLSKPIAQGHCCDALDALLTGRPEVILNLPQESQQFLLRLVRGEIISLSNHCPFFSPLFTLTVTIPFQAQICHELEEIEHLILESLRKTSRKRKELSLKRKGSRHFFA
ncbi:MAG: hypothetical protein ABIH38_05275 [Patescibacteria group bacterium]